MFRGALEGVFALERCKGHACFRELVLVEGGCSFRSVVVEADADAALATIEASLFALQQAQSGSILIFEGSIVTADDEDDANAKNLYRAPG